MIEVLLEITKFFGLISCNFFNLFLMNKTRCWYHSL